MSFLSRLQRYEFLKAVKQHTFPGMVLTKEEDQFIQDFAFEKLTEILSDPEVKAVFERIKDR